jgi:hypothetical protein
MGTRNLTIVTLKNEYKVAQYGQWDGYPSGQGTTICEFIQNKMNLEKFKKAVSECSYIDPKKFEEMWRKAGADERGLIEWSKGKAFGKKYPEFDRDAAAGILELIQESGVRLLKNSLDFAGDSLMCEWAYVLDLDNEILEVYQGFNKRPLDENERFAFLKPKDFDGKDYSYYQVRLLKKIPFKDATPEAMEQIEQTEVETEELQAT